MPVVPRVLVALEKNGIALSNQEPRGRVAREVIVKSKFLGLALVAPRRSRGRPRQQRRCRSATHQPTLIDLVEMALATDKEGYTLTRSALADRTTHPRRHTP